MRDIDTIRDGRTDTGVVGKQRCSRTGKRRYADERTARTAINAIRNGDLAGKLRRDAEHPHRWRGSKDKRVCRIYLCEFCNGFHVTKLLMAPWEPLAPKPDAGKHNTRTNRINKGNLRSQIQREL